MPTKHAHSRHNSIRQQEIDQTEIDGNLNIAGRKEFDPLDCFDVVLRGSLPKSWRASS